LQETQRRLGEEAADNAAALDSNGTFVFGDLAGRKFLSERSRNAPQRTLLPRFYEQFSPGG
jgi:hypothetical protein